VAGGTIVRDRVRPRVGFGPAGRAVRAALLGRDLERIFDCRRTAMLDLPAGCGQAPRHPG